MFTLFWYVGIYRIYFSFKLKKWIFAIVEKPQVEKQDTFTEKLITQIIKNLQVKISNIHVRYEDDVSIVNKLHLFLYLNMFYCLLIPAL